MLKYYFLIVIEAAPQIDEHEQNLKIIKSNVKVFGGAVASNQSQAHVDKRPKKENEQAFNYERKQDIDYEKYGYSKPDKIKSGHLTLRNFDELINEFKQAKKETSSSNDVELIHVNLANKYNLDPAQSKVLIEYYKPFYVLGSDKKKQANEEGHAPIGSIFPNLTNKTVPISDKTTNENKNV